MEKDSFKFDLESYIHLLEVNMTPPSQPRMHSRDDVARFLGISKQTIDRLIRSGDLPALKIGRRVLISDADLQALIARKYAWKRGRPD